MKKIAKSFFPYRKVKNDPAFESEFCKYIVKNFSSKERSEIYEEFKLKNDEFSKIVKKVIFKTLCKKVGRDLNLSRNVSVKHPETFEIGEHVYIGPDVFLQGWYKGKLKIGNGTWVGPGVYIDAKDVIIKDKIGIGPAVKFISSQHTGMPSDIPVYMTDHIVETITVESGADIGVGAVILPGVKIGRNSIIGAGAVVNKDIPSDSVAAGIPAKVIKRRGK
ncbi:MAG: acyltransferase [bacterium]